MPRIFFTGRRQIARGDISLVFHPGQPPAFEASINLSRHRRSLPSSVRVFVEAYHNTMLQRFDFGVPSDCRPRETLVLTNFDEWDRPRFRVRVVGTGDQLGVILASCDRVDAIEPGESDEGGRSMLQLYPKPDSEMSGELWKIASAGGGYQLWYNKDVSQLAARIKGREPDVLGLILPAAIREILAREHLWDGISAEANEWTRFAQRVSGEPFPQPRDPGGISQNDVEEWIDNVIAAFCRNRAHFVERIAANEESRP